MWKNKHTAMCKNRKARSHEVVSCFLMIDTHTFSVDVRVTTISMKYSNNWLQNECTMNALLNLWVISRMRSQLKSPLFFWFYSNCSFLLYIGNLIVSAKFTGKPNQNFEPTFKVRTCSLVNFGRNCKYSTTKLIVAVPPIYDHKCF